MTSPFEIVKSLTQTKDNLYTTESMFEKEYTPFMINRILSNSPKTVLFADAMNQHGVIDKKLQYDFYRLGIPKSNSYTKWIKKETHDLDQDHIDFICHSMNVSVKRAIELYGIIGADVVQAQIDSKGGVVK